MDDDVMFVRPVSDFDPAKSGLHLKPLTLLLVSPHDEADGHTNVNLRG
jgi:hypothetical protein